jgi:hypothetical protein
MLCVAAETMSVPPSALRPALIAAFGRARELGLSVAAAESTLRGRDAGGTGEAGGAKAGKVRK